MTETDVLTQERVARNDDAFRKANERIRRSAETHDAGQRVPFLCECADPTCSDVIVLPLEEYASVREHPRRFVVVRSHAEAAEGAAEVVEERDGYAVVEKVGRAGEVAEKLAGE